MIKLIPYHEIEKVWSTKLWPGRKDIEQRSAMKYLGGYDMLNMTLPFYSYGYFKDDLLVGVNSVHACGDNSTRSRGLWVDPQFRGQGIGRELLKHGIHHAIETDSYFIWSYPRFTSWKTYESVGFKLTSDWSKSDTSDRNAYCILEL